MLSGSPSIDTVVWHYQDSDVSGFNEDTLQMYDYDGSWNELTDVLDTGANTLTVTNIASFSDFGILYTPPYYVSVSVADAYETENKTFTVTMTSTIGEITGYDVLANYNNTPMLYGSVSGLADTTIILETYVVAPLVESDPTNIPWDADVNMTIAMVDYPDTDEGNQSVQVYYEMADYTHTPAASYTVEAKNNITITVPTKPATAPEDVSYSSTYTFPDCTWVYANGTESNETCGNTIVNDFMQNYSVLPSHELEDGLIYSDVWVNRQYDLSFDATTESTSSKSFNETLNVTRDYFVWIVEDDNGSINGTSYLSNWLNISYYLEEGLTNTTADSVVASFITTFQDGTTKNFPISYAGTLHNSIIQGYPNFSSAEISSVEVYSKSGYTTRSRFMAHADVNLSDSAKC